MNYTVEDELRIAALKILTASFHLDYNRKSAAMDFRDFRELEEEIGWEVAEDLKPKIDRTYEIMCEKKVITSSGTTASDADEPEVIPVYRFFYKALQVK
jgi:hypothetical protein